MKIQLLKGPTVRISASANDWNLYDADTLEQEQDRDFVADTLNKKIADIIATSPSRKEVSIKDIQMLLDGYSAWGAADTEGVNLVDSILDQVYSET